MITPINAIFSRNLVKIKDENVENDFFSSNDSEEEPNEILRKKNKKRKRNSILNLEPQKIDIFPDKREENIKNINELRHIHNSKETKLRNEKIGWNLVYMLLFSDFFNSLREKQLNLKNNQISFFNLKEIELRIKKMINKIQNKKVSDNNITNKDEEKMEFPAPRWIDRPFTVIINDFKFNEKEKDDFIPSYITSFRNFSDNETKKHQRAKSKPAMSTFISPKNNIPQNRPNSNLTLKSNNNLNIPTFSIERKRKSMANADPILNNFTQFLKKKENKVNSSVNSIKSNSNRNQNKGAILNINFKPKENIIANNFSNPNIELLRNNKKFYDMLVNKYPRNEEDILNIKNNFMAYDIELNKNEAIFKRPENLVIKHFFDFHIDNKF